MTTFVTREEYERLSARLGALERSGKAVTVTVDSHHDEERISRWIRQALEAQHQKTYEAARRGNFMRG